MTAPRELHKAALRRLVRRLKDGPLEKISTLCVFALEEAGHGLINLRGPTDASLLDTPDFAMLRGFTTGSGGISTGVDPAVNPGLMTRNGNHFGLVILTEDGDGGFDFGNTQFCLSARNLAGQTYTRCGAAASTVSTNLAKGSYGYWLVGRDDAGSYKLWHDGVLLRTINQASEAFAPGMLYVGNANGISSTRNTRSYGLFHLGGALTADDVAVLTAAITEYFVDIGQFRQTVLRPLHGAASPPEGATGVSRNPIFETSPYEHRHGSEGWAHKSTTYQARRASDDAILWQSVSNKVDKTLIQLPLNALPTATDVYYWAQHIPTVGAGSQFSARRSFRTA